MSDQAEPADGNADFVPHVHSAGEQQDPNAVHGANTEDEKLGVFRDADHVTAP